MVKTMTKGIQKWNQQKILFTIFDGWGGFVVVIDHYYDHETPNQQTLT
jgi:hypothetical protein